MPNIIANHNGMAFAQIQMQAALIQIKADIEHAIVQLGEAGKNALIRSQAPIRLIHDAVKTQLINAGVNHTLINPHVVRLRNCANPNYVQGLQPIILVDKELCLAGHLKTKKQDISLVPNNIPISSETLTFPTYLNGYTDPFGKNFTESVISINVRSQLSSVAKNFDTLYERTIAEALNFHLRVPKMVLGEVYMIVVKEYSSKAAAQNTIAFNNTNHIEKYILAFQALNDRVNITDPDFKYERIALLIVDFSPAIPKLYSTTQELKNDGLINNNSLANLDPLSFNGFVSDLLTIYAKRFPANTFN